MAAAGVLLDQSSAAVDPQRLVASCCGQTASVAVADWSSWTSASLVLELLAVVMVKMHYWQQHWRAAWQADLYPGPATGCGHQYITLFLPFTASVYACDRSQTTAWPLSHSCWDCQAHT